MDIQDSHSRGGAQEDLDLEDAYAELEVEDHVDQPIYLMACDCSELFDKCLEVSKSGTATEQSLSNEVSRFVWEYKGRFDAWASFLGVFAGEKSCLDYRLRNHSALQDMVIRLLDILRRNLFLVSVYNHEDPTASKGVNDPVDAAGDHIMKDALPSSLNVAFSSIEESITRLNKLGIAIRLSSRSTVVARARNFAAQNPELIRLGKFEDRAYLALQSLYPNASERLRQQLVDAMTDRYVKLQYEFHRMRVQTSTNLSSNAPSPRPGGHEQRVPAPQTAKPNTEQTATGPTEERQRITVNFRSFPQSSIDTTRLHANLEAVATKSVAKSKPAKTLTAHTNRQREPPCPKFKAGEDSTPCEWCFQIINRSLIKARPNNYTEWSDEGRWHYRNDLQPYVCIAESCCKSRPTYPSSREWISHMMSTHSEYWSQNIHGQSLWTCPAEHENDSCYVFSTRDELDNHILLQHEHAEGLRREEVSETMAKQYGVENWQLASSCPLCLFRLDADPAQETRLDGVTAPTETSQGEKKRLGLHRQSIKKVKLASSAVEANNITTSWAMGSHIAEHLHYLMIVSLQLMSAMDGAAYGEGDTDDDIDAPSSRVSAPGQNELEDKLADLPSEVQGSIAWSDVGESVPVKNQEELLGNEAELPSRIRAPEALHSNPKGTERVAAAASLIDLIELSNTIAVLCRDWAEDLEDGADKTGRLEATVSSVADAAIGLRDHLRRNPEGPPFPPHLAEVLENCSTLMSSLYKKLNTHTKNPFPEGLHTPQKWPFGVFDLIPIVGNLQQYHNELFSTLEVEIMREIYEMNDKGKKVPGTLAVARGAIFDSNENQLNARCHPGTRQELLHQIRAWANDPQGKFMFCVSGMAGTGKSTIARTVAQIFNDEGRMGASFFFEKGDSERGNVSRFVTTIAVQLLKVLPDMKPHIESAIEEESDITSRPLREQFDNLIFQPLKKLSITSQSLVLVIDALDELNERNDIGLALSILCQLGGLTTIRVQVFLTSRTGFPGSTIYQIPSGPFEVVRLENIPPATIEPDIRIFLMHEFAKLQQRGSLPHDWPGDENIQKLASMATPLFVFAQDICRFVADGIDGGISPQERLIAVLKRNMTPIELHGIYFSALGDITEYFSDEEFRTFGWDFRRIVGSIITLASPLTVHSLANLLDIPEESVSLRLELLSSVLLVPSNQKLPVRLLHPSFRDFLLDPGKESVGLWFRINEKETHAMIATRCLEVLSRCLKENICSLEFPGMPRTELDSAKIDEGLPEYVQYACRYWVYHLASSGTGIANGDIVDTFLRDHFLHWIEALSLMGQISECVDLVENLASLVDQDELGSEMSLFFDDAKNFIRQNLQTIKATPLQLYSSCLIFSPTSSIIRTMFWKHVPEWIHRFRKTPKFWGGELGKVEWHSSFVTAVTFSPSGEQLASASLDCTIKLWDTRTGVQMKTLEGHTGRVNAVTFSPDGKHLASVANDYTGRLWDVATGEHMRTFEGYGGLVNTIAFSPDGMWLASASSDCAVQIWTVATGEHMMTIEGPGGLTNMVVFSADGKHLAFASDDSTVRVLNTVTWRWVKVFEGHTEPVRAVAFSTDGDRLASAASDYTVRLWDLETGLQVATLRLDGIIRGLKFSTDGGDLETDKGMLSITPSYPPSTEILLQKAPGKIFLERHWITLDGRNLLWLPPGYRGSCSALRGKLLVMGQTSGEVSFFGFSSG
ncbi:hypothetical protein TWF281_004586 [Arthrobotrys megalospora]